MTIDALEHGVEHGEDLHVAVVVHGGDAVGLEVVGVDHVHVVEIDGGGLIGDVDGMAEREVPDREGLELGIARADAALVLMVELAETGGHLAAAGAGRRDDDEGARRLDIIVLAEAVVADDELDIVRIIGDDEVAVDLQSQLLETELELFRRALAAKMREHHAADVEPAAAERVDQAEGVLVIGDAEVAAALVALDVVRRDDDDDLRVVLHLHEHAHLAVRLEARQDAGGVIIVKELAAEFQIELAAEKVDPLADLFRLHAHVFVVVKTDQLHTSSLRIQNH